MKKVMCQLLFAFSLMVLLSTQGWAKDAETARVFLGHIYDQYTGSGKGPNTLGKDAPDLFAPELLALIREDQRKSQGEVGLLDHDPICSCQDFEGLKVIKIKVAPVGHNRAKAKVKFVNGGNEVEIGFLLIRKSGQWRILDIKEPNVPSLIHYLKKGLKETESPSKQ
jgi:hypothetical protein